MVSLLKSISRWIKSKTMFAPFVDARRKTFRLQLTTGTNLPTKLRSIELSTLKLRKKESIGLHVPHSSTSYLELRLRRGILLAVKRSKPRSYISLERV